MWFGWTWLLTVLSWAHLQLVVPVVRWWEEVVLSSWEEWLLALVRQAFEEATRFLNALGAWFLSLFSKRSYRDQLRRAWQENSWQQWWGEVASRPSTLNALVANLVAQQQQQNNNGGVASEDPPSLDKSAASSQAAAAPAASGLSSVGGAAWWPRPIRQGVDSMGRLRQQGASISARLERPVVFVQQSGMGILDELAKRRHGLIEDAKMAAQLAVSRCFDLARSTVRAMFFLPGRDSMATTGGSLTRRGGCAGDGELGSGAAAGSARRCVTGGASGPAPARGGYKAHLPRSKSAHVNIAEMVYQPGAGAGSASASMARRGLLRSRSYGRLHTGETAFIHHVTEAPSDALSVIRAAGYPHELHTVTTDDGYVLRMERIPRPGARDVVFFMHGVLDTSMAWVSGGVTGSQAFAAWEAGMDVWLGNSRGNAPRQHQDPSRRGWRYWEYNINHMGMYDIAAQLDHIHNTKCAELGAGTVTLDLDRLGPLAGRFFGGAGASNVGKRTSANSSAGPGSYLLPGRAISTLVSSGLEDPSAHSGPAGSHAATRMRQSNSDSNLYRWGSCNSASSVGRAALPDISSSSASSGTVGVLDGPSRGTHTLLAPATPRQLSPQQQCIAAATGPSASIVSTASLGRAVSSQRMLSPMASFGNSEGDSEEGASGGFAHGLGEAEPSRGIEREQQRLALELEPTGALGFEQEAAGGLPDDGAAPSAGRLSPLLGPPGSSAQSHCPLPPVCHNAVTLTVVAEHTGVLAASRETARTAPTAPMTFTLEAKTRRDFGPSATDAERHALSRPATAVSGTALPERPTQGVAGADAGREAGGGGGAASMMDVMNSVLGPAADAVTHAVTSAGAAIATAAVSATHMLLASPQRPSAATPPPASLGAAMASASAPQQRLAPSPFAAPESQASVAANGAMADIEALTVGCPAADDVGLAPQSVWPPAPAARGVQLELEPQQVHQRLVPPLGGVCDGAGACAAETRAAVPIASPVAKTPRENGASRMAAAAAPAAVGESGTRQHNGLRSNGNSFRRACSTNHLAATAGCAPGSAVALTPTRLAAAEQSGSSNFSAGLSVSSASDVWTATGIGASMGGNPEVAAAAAPCQSVGLAGGRRADMGGGAGRTASTSMSTVGSPCPYKLRCVAHSLGGMSMLIHLINRLREGRPHYINRLLLLTPAGFHKHFPRAATVVKWGMPLFVRALRAVLGQSFCFPLYIPTPLGRALTFKLLLSASRIPGLGELLRLGFKALLDGDISQWDRALQMPHYSAQDMPAISVDQVLHLIQLVCSDAFRLYDYGSPAANVAHYGSPTPPDVSREYWRLDLPVHLVAGRKDGIIPPPNIHRHLEAMKAQGVAVSYREFNFGHLDFTFGVKEELRMYLMKVLRL